MNHRTLGLGWMAVLTLAACGGSNENTPPQTPSSTTTTSYSSPAPVATQEPAMPPTTSSTTSSTSTSTTPSSIPNAGQPTIGQPSSGTSEGAAAGTAMSSGSATDTAVVNDAQIAAVLDAANRGEIAQAQVAVKKTKNMRVKHFAEHMITDHSNAEASLKSVEAKDGITPREGPMSDQLKEGSERVMSSIGSKTGAELDHAYIDAQVDQHQKVLDAIDRFLQQTQNADVKGLLSQVRTKVAAHLGEARDIQSELSK